jgi:hypothetical protein
MVQVELARELKLLEVQMVENRTLSPEKLLKLI